MPPHALSAKPLPFPSRIRALSHGVQVTAVALILCVAVAAPATAQIPVTAAWDPNADGLTVGYRVSVGTSPGSAVAVFDVGNVTSVVLPLPPSGVYYVAVRGYTADGVEGPSSPEAVVDLTSAPGTPTGLEATVSGATANLRWSPPDSGGVALRYLVSVGTAPGASNVLGEYSAGSVHAVSGALPPGTYFARIQAGNMVGIGPPSADVTFRVGGSAPPNPPSALAASVSGSIVTLRWVAPSGGAASYVIEAGSRRGAIDIGSHDVGTATSFTVATPPGTYYIRIRAVSAAGTSGPSNEVVLNVK